MPSKQSSKPYKDGHVRAQPPDDVGFCSHPLVQMRQLGHTSNGSCSPSDSALVGSTFYALNLPEVFPVSKKKKIYVVASTLGNFFFFL